MTLADQLQKMLAAHPDDPRTPQGNALHHRFMVLEAGDYTGMETLCSEAIEAIEQMEISLSEAVSAERARCIAAVPTTWLDSLLTGPKAVMRSEGDFTCPDIEALCKAIRERMENQK